VERRCGESPMLVFRPDHMLELVLDTEQPTPIVPLGWQSGGLKGICGRKVASGKINAKSVNSQQERGRDGKGPIEKQPREEEET
jgi:hypothetical protein